MNDKFLLSVSALRLYASTKGRDFINVEDINVILETSPEVLYVILSECKVTLGEFMKVVETEGGIGIKYLSRPLWLITWVLMSQFKSIVIEE